MDIQTDAGAALHDDAPREIYEPPARRSQAIDRCSITETQHLIEDYILADLPVVIPDAAAHWPARQRWTPDFFRRHHGDVTTEIDGRRWTLAEYLDGMETATADHPLPCPFSFDMRDGFAERIADVQPQPRFGRIDRLGHPLMHGALLAGTRQHELFFGGSGSVFRRLHYDALFLHGHITQIRGDKEFFLYPPEQTSLMYPSRDNPKLSRIDDPADPDWCRFPLFAAARPYRTVLREGETIFFPAGWWHYTVVRGPCIAYGGVALTASNWPKFIADNVAYRRRDSARWKAESLRLYGHLAGLAMRVHEGLAPRPWR
ncbi:cupin-like domain-containing protein [Solimonas marina]|uniref:Transcription factor n=1 Tax=Solimonas marina TaxID=2714601 RepID=A0A969WDX6_9GAMM|nr:cupin-like domain-containing protein [Solimonas marina]NKF24439.1 transcription factor [Solimonas marina]